jgi:hypothetical protein
MNKVLGALALSALVIASPPADAAQKTMVRLPEHTVVLAHLLTELNSSTAKKDDYVDFVVDNDVIENGYILIHGGTRGSAQVTEAHEAHGSGKAGGMKVNFLFLYSSDHQQIPIDGGDVMSPPDRDYGVATGVGILLAGWPGLFMHNFVHGSDSIIPTSHKGYIEVLGSHMIAVDPVNDVAPPNSPDARVAPPAHA